MDQPAARLLRAAGERGSADGSTGALFQAIHEEHQQLFDEQRLADWVGKNGGNAEKFAAAYVSFGINNQTVQADKMAEDYRGRRRSDARWWMAGTSPSATR